jgi:hypothetical protein
MDKEPKCPKCEAMLSESQYDGKDRRLYKASPGQRLSDENTRPEGPGC